MQVKYFCYFLRRGELIFFFRFVILKLVPRDHVDQLPVPKRIKDYLKTPNYYSENITEEEEDEEKPIDESTTPEDYAAAM